MVNNSFQISANLLLFKCSLKRHTWKWPISTTIKTTARTRVCKYGHIIFSFQLTNADLPFLNIFSPSFKRICSLFCLWDFFSIPPYYLYSSNIYPYSQRFITIEWEITCTFGDTSLCIYREPCCWQKRQNH